MATAKKTTKTATSTKKTTKVGIEAPWHEFAKILINLFENDDEVTIGNDYCETSGKFNINIHSTVASKLAAIKRIIGESRQMGNIEVIINYILEDSSVSCKDFEVAFGDTGYFEFAEAVKTAIGTFEYAVFSKKIIQFFNDDTSDYYGNANYVVEDAVRVVADPTVSMPSFSTFVEEAE